MNFENNFERDFEKYVADNNLMCVYYSDYNNLIDCNSVLDAEAISFVCPYRSVRLPKNKLITLEYVLDKLSTNKNFVNLSKIIRGILGDGMNCYPTSYGIGVFCIYWRKMDVSHIEKLLTDNNIEYYNEYSDAHFVYRFKISKSKENIEKIKRIITY